MAAVDTRTVAPFSVDRISVGYRAATRSTVTASSSSGSTKHNTTAPTGGGASGFPITSG